MGNVRLALLVMTASVLASCATDPPRQSVDARAICEQMTRDSASSPALVSPDFFKQCMIARGASQTASGEIGRTGPAEGTPSLVGTTVRQ